MLNKIYSSNLSVERNMEKKKGFFVLGKGLAATSCSK